MRSLRGRVTLAAVGAVTLVVITLVALLVLSLSQDQRSAQDALLVRRAQLVAELLRRVDLDTLTGLERPGPGEDDLVLRITDGDRVIREVGEVPTGLPVPAADRFATVRAGGAWWRTYTVTVEPGSLRVQAAVPTTGGRLPREQVRRIAGLSLASLGLAAGLSWVLAGVVLRPLARLRDAAQQVSATGDLSVRVPAAQDSSEVDEVARSYNAMLARLQAATASTERALEASRRFTADAGHELRTPLTSISANLDVLARNPDLSPEQRSRILADVRGEQARLLGLLDALQSLARGDATVEQHAEAVDLADLADRAVAAAAARHPRVRFHLAAPDEPVMLQGSPEGLRLLLDNLLENAARHGAGRRPGGGGVVEVALAAADGQRVLTVDDDGPGVPAAEREQVFERFVRGSGAAEQGSGLGLALVAQQVRLHRGTVRIDQSLRGGARVRVTVPATSD